MKKNTQNFEIAYSIGDTCGGALHLRKRKMRFASGPLDWLAGGDFAYRTSTIIEDFQDFMREEDLELRQRDFSQGMHFEHDYYHNIKSGIQHFHDFKTGIPLKDSYPQVKKKYERRIKRLQHDLSTKKILLVWFSLEQQTSDKIALEYCNKIINKYGPNVHFLLIEHSENEPGIRHVRLSDNISRYYAHLQIIADNGSVNTMGHPDRVDTILSNYEVQNSVVLRKHKKAKRKLSRFLTAFIPIKKWRKQLRAKLERQEDVKW